MEQSQQVLFYIMFSPVTALDDSRLYRPSHYTALFYCAKVLPGENVKYRLR